MRRDESLKRSIEELLLKHAELRETGWFTVGCDDGYAWTSPVGVYRANAFGLHDMQGNVTEWVQDCWNASYADAPVNGEAWVSGDCSRRVLRGGSWIAVPFFMRSAIQGRNDTDLRLNDLGFRLARTFTGSAAMLQEARQQQETEQQRQAKARQQAEEAERQRQAEEAKRQAERKERISAYVDQQMITVQGGEFTMGCTEGPRENCYSTQKPAHRVRVGSFELSKFEVTQQLWQVVTGENPSEFAVVNCPRCPVETVNWDDIQMFLETLNALTGERYRLPTEAEWEYAARGRRERRGYRYAGSIRLVSVSWYSEDIGKENSSDRAEATE